MSLLPGVRWDHIWYASRPMLEMTAGFTFGNARSNDICLICSIQPAIKPWTCVRFHEICGVKLKQLALNSRILWEFLQIPWCVLNPWIAWSWNFTKIIDLAVGKPMINHFGLGEESGIWRSIRWLTMPKSACNKPNHFTKHFTTIFTTICYIRILFQIGISHSQAVSRLLPCKKKGVKDRSQILERPGFARSHHWLVFEVKRP